MKKKLPGDMFNLDLNFAMVDEAEIKALRKDEFISKIIPESLPEGFVAGWASTPNKDHHDHVVMPGAFDAAIAARGLTGPNSIKLLHGHSWDRIAGKILMLETRNGKLWIAAQLNLNVSYVRDLYEVAKQNEGLSFSVGFYLQDYSFKKDAAGEQYVEITRVDLIEVSMVPFASNEECMMTFIKSREEAAPATIAEFERYLINNGLASSRNQCKRIVYAVKHNAALFATLPVAPVASVPPAPPPMLADTSKQLDALSEMIATMKQSLAPVAK